MRAAVNDGLRFLIGVSLRTAGAIAEALHRARVRRHDRYRSRLQKRFDIRSETPLAKAVPPAEPASARPERGAVRIALTSGTSGDPKPVAYTRRRLAAVRWVFIDSFMRMFWALGVRRTSLYVFGPMEEDQSLSSLLLSENRPPGYLASLQAPYRIQAAPWMRRLNESYGTAAVRLWILALSNPGVLYSTNPSTMSTFFDELDADWERCSALVRDFTRDPSEGGQAARAVARRLASRGHRERLTRIAASRTGLPIAAWAPAVRVYVCWTGGYVAPFLDRLARHLPPGRFRLVPMYSMSTETIETIPDFRTPHVAFLPVARGVYCEFMEEGATRVPRRLLAPGQLAPEVAYELVVSDGHGLRRYCTDDVFKVEGFVENLPDLRFLRRRGLAYSFTGEKLTGAQVASAFRRLRSAFSELSDEHGLTCVPSRQPAESLPHYRMVVVGSGDLAPGPTQDLPGRFDALLCEVNPEYRAKRASGRLGRVRLERVALRELRERLPDGSPSGMDSQFKFLPLYPRLWECREGGRAAIG